MLKNNRSGISLIVLVITIIIMIILAAAIIISLQNTGIIGAAKNAVCKTNIKEAKNLAVLKWAELYTNGERDLVKIKGEIIKEFNANKLNADDYEIEVTTGGVEVTAKAGCIDVSEGVTKPDNNNEAKTDWVYAYTYTAADGWSQKLTNDGTEITGDIVAKFYETGEILPEVSTKDIILYSSSNSLPEGPAYKMVVEGSGPLDLYVYEGAENNAWYDEIFVYKESYNQTYIGGYVTDVELSNQITEIGEHVFEAFLRLRNISMPDNLTEIGDCAFQYTAISNIVVPETVKLIGAHAFADNSNLKSASITGSVDDIGSYAFQNCTSLSNVTLPNNLIIIRDSSFENCTALENITLPEELVYISTKAFKDCTALKSIKFTPKIIELYNNAFENCILITELSFPESLEEIGDAAFKGCTGIKEVEIPATIRFQHEYIFQNCTGLEKAVINSTSSFPGMFYGCSSLTDVTITDNAYYINGEMFKNCTSLKSIKLPASVAKINGYAFEGCTALESIVIPNNEVELYSYVFKGCTSLKEITLPKTITFLKSYNFSECTALKTINYGGTEEEWNSIILVENQSIPSTTKINYGYQY